MMDQASLSNAAITMKKSSAAVLVLTRVGVMAMAGLQILTVQALNSSDMELASVVGHADS